jgi:2-haloacid dehalogenase
MADRPVSTLQSVIFDLGGVLVDWNPRYLYRKLLGDEAAVDRFLSQICTPDWNELQDGGRPIADAVAELCSRHPSDVALIRAYYERWPEMLGGKIESTVELLNELRSHDVALYFLTNWSAETFPIAERSFEFLNWFRGGIVSGRERLKKPSPEIYTLALQRFGIDPRSALYIDDRSVNLVPARALGMDTHCFQTAAALRQHLARRGILTDRQETPPDATLHTP